MANPRFLSGSTGALDPTSIQKSASLTTLLHGVLSHDPISVVLPDFTRPLPFEQLLPSVEQSFPNLLHWVVGLGLHRQLTSTELRFLQDLTDRPIHQHNPDKCIAIDKRDGQDLGISHHLFASRWILTTGVIEIHQYAGVSGGYKLTWECTGKLHKK